MIFNTISEIDLNDNNILQILNEKIKEKYITSEALITEKIYEELIKISIKICSLKQYDYESILFFIKQAERNFLKLKNENFIEIINQNFRIIEKLINEESKSLSINIEKEEEEEEDDEEENHNGINSVAVESLLLCETDNAKDKYKEKLKLNNKILNNLIYEANLASIFDVQQGLIV